MCSWPQFLSEPSFPKILFTYTITVNIPASATLGYLRSAWMLWVHRMQVFKCSSLRSISAKSRGKSNLKPLCATKTVSNNSRRISESWNCSNLVKYLGSGSFLCCGCVPQWCLWSTVEVPSAPQKEVVDLASVCCESRLASSLQSVFWCVCKYIFPLTLFRDVLACHHEGSKSALADWCCGMFTTFTPMSVMASV